MKACPVLLRRSGGHSQVLAFRHPLAGVQIVKGTVGRGEHPRAAACRELCEEAGVSGVRVIRHLGQSQRIHPGQVWDFWLLDHAGLPDAWHHAAVGDDGHIYGFFWHDLSALRVSGFAPRYRRALRFIADHAGRLAQ
jgi:8-oxo-dGTP pyrophosphatase MutT (NUDIX family)